MFSLKITFPCWLRAYEHRTTIRCLFITLKGENNPLGAISRCKNGFNDGRNVIVITFASHRKRKITVHLLGRALRHPRCGEMSDKGDGGEASFSPRLCFCKLPLQREILHLMCEEAARQKTVPGARRQKQTLSKVIVFSGRWWKHSEPVRSSSWNKSGAFRLTLSRAERPFGIGTAICDIIK